MATGRLIMTAKIYPDLFKRNYPELKGRNWLLSVSVEDRKAFSRIGFAHSGYGRQGGIKRAKTALRDKKGKFVCNESATV